MDYTKLIAALLPLVAEYGPQLIHDITDLIHQDPNATVEQIQAKIAAKIADARTNDASVEQA
jgi:hypothetical protein